MNLAYFLLFFFRFLSSSFVSSMWFGILNVFIEFGHWWLDKNRWVCLANWNRLGNLVLNPNWSLPPHGYLEFHTKSIETGNLDIIFDFVVDLNMISELIVPSSDRHRLLVPVIRLLNLCPSKHVYLCLNGSSAVNRISVSVVGAAWSWGLLCFLRLLL